MSHSIFLGNKLVFRGTLPDAVAKWRELHAAGEQALVFEDFTGRTVDIDLRASSEVQATETKAGPGRPKLGVVSREVSLLPRHWEWLLTQPGGASVTLRKLVEEARRNSKGIDAVRQAQEATYRFMMAMAGDLPGYEEALRALFAREEQKFSSLVRLWPDDIRDHVQALAERSFKH